MLLLQTYSDCGNINTTMNENRQIFVNTYLTNGYNATQAYKTAYPECKSGWNAHGARLIAIDSIKQAIDKAKKGLEEWLEGGRKLCDRLFSERYFASVLRNENANAIRCVENKAKNVGYYAEDNAQKAEQQTLNTEQQVLYDDYLAYRRRMLLKEA